VTLLSPAQRSAAPLARRLGGGTISLLLQSETRYNGGVKDREKKVKFSFEELRTNGLHPNSKTRKKAFVEYFEMFEEFPSFLFDNLNGIDKLLSETIDDIQKDPETPQKMQKGIEALLERLMLERRSA